MPTILNEWRLKMAWFLPLAPARSQIVTMAGLAAFTMLLVIQQQET